MTGLEADTAACIAQLPTDWRELTADHWGRLAAAEHRISQAYADAADAIGSVVGRAEARGLTSDLPIMELATASEEAELLGAVRQAWSADRAKGMIEEWENRSGLPESRRLPREEE